jgi:DsbC/DsbD-like thiol-disulfide interchange protein/cytochrome c biogenesis protein CcdA/thiol-disulfide isomerase/thioredoxin
MDALLLERSAVAPGGEVRLALKIRITDGWVLYHDDLGDPNAIEKPTVVTLEAPGVTFSRARFPKPVRKESIDKDLNENEVNAHKGDITVWALGTVDNDAPVGDRVLEVRISGLICKDFCVEFKEMKKATFRVAAEASQPRHAEVFKGFPADLAPPPAEPLTPPPPPATPPGPDSLLSPGSLLGGPSPVPSGNTARAEVLLERSTVKPGGELRVAIPVTIDEGWHLYHDEKGPPDAVGKETSVTLEAEGVRFSKVKFPPPEKTPQPGLGDGGRDTWIYSHHGRIVLYALGRVDAEAAYGERSIRFEIDGLTCKEACRVYRESKELTFRIAAEASEPGHTGVFKDFPPGLQPEEPGAASRQPGAADMAPGDDGDVLTKLDDFEILATAGGYLDTEDFLAFVDEAETGVQQKGLFEDKTPLVIVLLVILGGIALNLTPCVLPIIPINLMIIGAGAKAGSRARGFALGGTYGLAMALVYGVLGLVAIGGVGAFGSLNSTIWFNVSIAALFVVLALAMFDVIAIDFTKYQGKLNITGKAKQGTFVLAFGMGAIAALLAGACVAPVVIQVVVYAGDQYARGSTIALALPFCLGLGMALPWPFAGAGLSLLPKPGGWMVRVKQAMGVFILAFAAYYGYLAWEIYSARHGTADPAAMHAEVPDGWTASLGEGLVAAQSAGKPVFIDMWATWCKNCLAMDKTTFKDEKVLDRLDGYVKVKFQAEDLAASPTKEMLERFEGIGLPTYAILRPAKEDSGS